MNTGKVGEPVKFFYPTCNICFSPSCRRPHRLFTYEGYLKYLSETDKPPALGQEADRMLFLTNKANAEFGLPGYSAGRCTVCFDEGCMRPHRNWTREGFALYSRLIVGLETDEKAVRMADVEYGIGAGLGSFADMDATLGGHAQSDDAGLGSFADMDAALGGCIRGGGARWYGDDGSTGEGAQGDEYYTEADGVLDWEVQNEMIFLKKKWNKGILTGSPRELHALREHIKDAWKRKVGDDLDIYGMMPWDGVDWDQMRKQCFPPGATPFQPESSSGPSPDIGWDELRAVFPLPGVTPLQPESSSGPRHDQSPSQSPPRGNSNTLSALEEIEMILYPPTTRRVGEDYEKSRQHFSELWHRQRVNCSSIDDLRQLKSLMQTAWELFVGPKGTDDSMPWHDDFIPSHLTTLSFQPLKDPSPDSSSSPSDRRYESQKLAFTEEWETMAHGKDATKRYALARLIQAAFATVVGPRSEEEDMPWTADLRRSKPAPAPHDSAGTAAGREQSQSQSQSQPQNTPLPGTSLETDYSMLRAEYAAIFLNRVNGEEREEVERVAGVFREAWVREVGVRAHDVRMPWDEVLAQQRDGVVEEGVEREVVGGRGGDLRERGRGGERSGRKGKKVEGWRRTRTRRGRSAGCEFQ